MRSASPAARGAIIIVLALVAIACLAPLINTLAVSFSSASSVAAGEVGFWPQDFTLYSYQRLLEDPRFFAAFGVSLTRVALGTAIQVVLTVLLAYPLSKENSAFRGRAVYVWIIVATMVFNGGLIAWYMVIRSFGLLDTILGLVLPSAVPVLYVLLLINFFRGIPRELEEAAMIDGAGAWRTLMRIYLPLSTPAIATVTLFSIVGHWNAFFDGLILINSPEKQPLQTYIQQLVVELTNVSTLTPEELARHAELSNDTLNAAKIVVAIVPILIIYPFLQRYFISGIVLGSVKE